MINLRYHRFRRVTLLGCACAGVLAGLGLVKLGFSVHGLWLLVALALLPLCFKRKIIAVVAAVVIGLLLGLYRGDQTQSQLQSYQSLVGEKVVLVGNINEDPGYGDKGQQEFRIGNVRLKTDDGLRDLPGQVRVTSFTITDVKRGDQVEVSGKLREGFGNYQGALYFAALESHVSGQNFIDELRQRFAAGVYNALPDPQASLGLGFLVGLRSELPEDLDDQLRIVGLTHIVVASGYNLTILVRLGRRFFASRSKYQAMAVSGTLIVGFVFVTGFSPSMTRAALVTSLALAAWYFGRKIHPVLILLLAAALTAAYNPLYLWSDLGWYLSFLSFAGVMLLAPLIHARFSKKEKPSFIAQVATETICAQAMTLPLILFIFGDLSVLALFANLLIVPLIPAAMLLTFVAGIVGMIAPALAGWIAFPATWLLTFMTEIVGMLARIPWAQIQVPIVVGVMMGMYGAVLAFGAILYRKTRFSFLSTSIID